MLYITGDLHGDYHRLENMKQEYDLKSDDYLIIAGDFGCIFGLGQSDEDKLDAIADLPFTVLFLDGNHECFPKIYSYPEEVWNGGKIHRIRQNVYHLMRGQVFEINGISFFTMGGGYSIDKIYRIPGRSWWPEEMPTQEEYKEAWDNLSKHDNRVDLIISHAAPEDTMNMFVETGVFAFRYPQESELNLFLENIRQTVWHRQYYFGHLHMDKCLFRNQIALYYDLFRADTGEKIIPARGIQ